MPVHASKAVHFEPRMERATSSSWFIQIARNICMAHLDSLKHMYTDEVANKPKHMYAKTTNIPPYHRSTTNGTVITRLLFMLHSFCQNLKSFAIHFTTAREPHEVTPSDEGDKSAFTFLISSTPEDLLERTREIRNNSNYRSSLRLAPQRLWFAHPSLPLYSYPSNQSNQSNHHEEAAGR
jgi:hypothetical protein